MTAALIVYESVVSVLLSVCLCFALASCQKTDIMPTSLNFALINDAANKYVSPIGTPDPILGNVNTTISLVGTWNIAKDSTYFEGSAFSNNTTSSNYAGTPGDHFKFTSDGRLFIKEKAKADTAVYIVSGDNRVIVSYLFYNGSPVSGYGSVKASFTQADIDKDAVMLVSSITTLRDYSIVRSNWSGDQR